MVRSKQRGVTLIGWIFLLTPMAIVVYAVIRVTPIYLNYMRVAKALEDVAKGEGGGNGVTATRIKTALEKQLDVESIEFPELSDFQVRREGVNWVIEANYEEKVPMFANLSLLLAFDKSVQLQ